MCPGNGYNGRTWTGIWAKRRGRMEVEWVSDKVLAGVPVGSREDQERTRKRGGARARYLKYLEYLLRGAKILPGSKKTHFLGLSGQD